MKLIAPSVEIIAIPQHPLELIELAGRTCYKSEDKITEGSAEKFVAMIIKRGHESVLEHVSVSARIICDRGVSHELVRHRLASYSQESTRYCDYNDKHITFIIPPWIDLSPGEYDSGTVEEIADDGACRWAIQLLDAETAYRLLRRLNGWKPEQARSVLPNSLKTEVVMTANLREWRHFFKLRMNPAAHPQMREIAIPLFHLMKDRIPVVFDDL